MYVVWRDCKKGPRRLRPFAFSPIKHSPSSSCLLYSFFLLGKKLLSLPGLKNSFSLLPSSLTRQSCERAA
jgi:hypothetical protein